MGDFSVKYFHDSLTKALTENNGYQVVEEPGPGMIRIRTAFTDLVPVNPIMNTATTIIPQARLLSRVIGAASGSNLYVGQVGMEVEFLDAQSNERLGAVAFKQAGEKYVPFTGKKFEPTATWGQVEQALDYWAQKLRKRVAIRCTVNSKPLSHEGQYLCTFRANYCYVSPKTVRTTGESPLHALPVSTPCHTRMLGARASRLLVKVTKMDALPRHSQRKSLFVLVYWFPCFACRTFS
jgi:hypothetical protein